MILTVEQSLNANKAWEIHKVPTTALTLSNKRDVYAYLASDQGGSFCFRRPPPIQGNPTPFQHDAPVRLLRIMANLGDVTQVQVYTGVYAPAAGTLRLIWQNLALGAAPAGGHQLLLTFDGGGLYLPTQDLVHIATPAAGVGVTQFCAMTAELLER
jgi:hypothetical protein